MHHDEGLPTQCPNCGAALAIDPHPRYCPLCGQETRLHPPSFGEFVHEFVGHYVALEGALWRTLAVLILQPGRLTREYLDGRRRRYVLPLRVYLSASFVFFLGVNLFGLGGQTLSVNTTMPADAAASISAADARPTSAWMARCLEPGGCGWLETRVARGMQRLSGAEGQKTVRQRLASTAPYAAFLMLPVFAALMKLAWRRSGQPYGAHFVFGLHQHAFAFLLLLALAPLPGAASDVALLLLFAHGVVAMRRVHGGTWPSTLARAGVVALAYGLVLLLATVAITGAAVLMG